MSYPKTNQTRTGTIHSASGNRKPQRGASKSNERASNAATNTDRATSDHYPKATSANAKQRGSNSDQSLTGRGYHVAKSSSPPARKVGNTIRKVGG